LSVLFSQCKFHYAKETHDVSSLLALVKILQHLGTKDNERSLCQDLLTIEDTDWDLKVHALYYANELLNVRVRLSFQKLMQTRQTNRNSKKLSKTGLGYD